MKTIIIDIINEKAVKLLQDLELLQLIRMHREKPQPDTHSNLTAKYKGAMQKQAVIEIDNQLNELRKAWD
jgi:hypothetical protein